MLAAYKSTVNIALANANIGIAAISLEVLEDYEDTISGTTSHLNDLLEGLTGEDRPFTSKWEQALRRLRNEDRIHFDLAEKSSDEPRIILDAVLAAANKRKEESLKKEWSLVIEGRAICVRDVLEKLAGWVRKLVVLPSLLICPELSVEVTESLINLYAAILQYLAEILRYLNLSTGKRILKSIGQSQEDFQAKYSPVKCALENFGRLAGISHTANLGYSLNLMEAIQSQLGDKIARDKSRLEWLETAMKQPRQPIDRIDTTLQEIEDGLKREDRARILRAVSSIPYGTHHKTTRKGRLEGSGTWFLKKPEFNE
ncbi:hypothetical protein GGR58DRAFT_502305 [Xylaria digitata]|nr:hypothetical protein GGR58DRAFT_502305 [Xylaria digitata]